MPKSWEAFLREAGEASLAPAFEADARPHLVVDDRLAPGQPGVALDNKGTTSPLGESRPSVVELVRDLPMPLSEPVLQDLSEFSDLAQRLCLEVEDASPDSVVGVLLFAARQAGVDVPDRIWAEWTPVITRWERTGNAEDPETSWPTLASALAHRHFGSVEPDFRHGPADLRLAWEDVVPFAVETMLAERDPAFIAPSEPGKYLALARAALAQERNRYARKLFASDLHQLELPVRGSKRRCLVDALLTREKEFAGALKVFARNDRRHSSVGMGFTLTLIERPSLKDVEPGAWMTFSLDERMHVHLFDLWCELERLETEAWHDAGLQRPPFGEHSRSIAGIPAALRRSHEPWFINHDHTLLASPRRQVSAEAGEAQGSSGSMLTSEQVREALFRVFDPFRYPRVRARNPSRPGPARLAEPAGLCRLIDVPVETVRDQEGRATSGTKRVLAAWWPTEDPLPHPAAPTEILPPTIVRGMAARTLGIAPERAVLDAPDLQDVDCVSFANSLAVITDGGVFLLGTGRARDAKIEPAISLASAQITLAHELDECQSELTELAIEQRSDLGRRGSTGKAHGFQRRCASLAANLVTLRGQLDQPLPSADAELGPLRDAISQRWSIRDRLQELADEVETLQQAGRAVEEARLFWVARLAAAFGLGLLFADSLSGPLLKAIEPLLAGRLEPLEPFLTGPRSELWMVLILAITAVALAVLVEALFRRPMSRQTKK